MKIFSSSRILLRYIIGLITYKEMKRDLGKIRKEKKAKKGDT